MSLFLNNNTEAYSNAYHARHSQQSGTPPPVHTAATLFQKLCYENKDALSAGIIVAGWDNEVGPSVYNIPLGGGLFRQPWAIGGTTPLDSPESTIVYSFLLAAGSGSTYVYGYCDATYKEGWNEEETINFVKNSTPILLYPTLRHTERPLPHLALSLAMSRDGSSGGVIRMCVITENGVERKFVPGDKLPKFWEGHEVLGKPVSLKMESGPAPMAVEPI